MPCKHAVQQSSQFVAELLSLLGRRANEPLNAVEMNLHQVAAGLPGQADRREPLPMFDPRILTLVGMLTSDKSVYRGEDSRNLQIFYNSYTNPKNVMNNHR